MASAPPSAPQTRQRAVEPELPDPGVSVRRRIAVIQKAAKTIATGLPVRVEVGIVASGTRPWESVGVGGTAARCRFARPQDLRGEARCKGWTSA